MTDRKQSEAGFSLVEVLISLFIVALIAASGATIIEQTATSRDSIALTNARVEKLNAANALMREDLAQWVPRKFRDQGPFDPALSFIGGNRRDERQLMTFVRDGWRNPGLEAPRSGLIIVRYMVENQALVREVRLAPDGVPGTEEIRETLLENVQSGEIEFRRESFWVNDWPTSQGQLDGAPEAVRVKLTMMDGRAYEWMFLTPAEQPNA